ncbi:MAG TPA: GatB/YqeY domain-containing protein [Roseiarcus sp.]|nr:GatB/YqeY domain-containing protein [Roseiarcus sp.]
MVEAAPLRDTVTAQMKEAMKSGDKTRVSALRLIMAALKDREIEARGAGKVVSRADELALLNKMVKSRQESAAIYEKAGRAELAAQENAEVAVISEFMPRQMDEAAMTAAVREAISATGATSVKDMGKVVNALKHAHPGEMDFAKASAIVRSVLAGRGA